MKGMAKSYKAANQADDAAALKQALTQMREYAVKAQGDVPPDFKDQAADGPERKAYTEGMTKVTAKPELVITHAPGYMFITDILNKDLTAS